MAGVEVGEVEPSLQGVRKESKVTVMALSLDEIVEEVAHLPEDVSAHVIERILVMRHGGIEPFVEEAWKGEARRRVGEIIRGEVQGIPMEDVFARAARVLGR